MFSKILVFLGLTALVQAGYVYQPAPAPEAPANYEFKYEVHEEKTGDIKRQSETAVNGAIKGQYSLVDADGLHRVVDYTADDHQGFLATVRREPTHIKVPQPAPKIEEAKVVVKYIHQAPAVKYVQAAPVVKYISAKPAAPLSHSSHGAYSSQSSHIGASSYSSHTNHH